MKIDRMHAWLMWALILVNGGFTHVLGNDSAASTAVGGIQLRREADISMEKERLTISETKVTVEYEFLNQTNKDITTVVAFPIPRYDYGYLDGGGPRDFGSFRLWVEGKERKYNTQVRAKMGGKDYTEVLKNIGINIASFGDYDTDRETGKPSGQITKLSKGPHDQLLHLGLIYGPDESFPEMPAWDVAKTYYWMQTFPAHKVLHVRHEYTPSVGFELVVASDLDPKNPHSNDTRDGIVNSCLDPSLRKDLISQAMKHYKEGERTPLELAWVDYILTTANSWKTPIKDFTLIIDKRSDSHNIGGAGMLYVGLCWEGPVKKLDSDHLLLHKTNFVPKKEFHVAFITFDAEPSK